MSGCAAPCEDAGNQVKQGYEAQAGSRTLPPNGGTCEVRLVRFRARHTSTHQVRAHTSPCPGELPITEQILSLPMYRELSRDWIAYVCEALRLAAGAVVG